MLKQRRSTLLVFYVVVFIFSVYLTQYIYRTNIYPDKQTIQYFQPMSIFLINKQLSVDEGFVQGYRADFLITYNVKGVQYNRWVSGNGLDASYDWDRRKQEAILEKYQVGRTYVSWYDPRHPQFSAFVLRHDWRAMFLLMSAVLLGFFTLYASLKLLFIRV